MQLKALKTITNTQTSSQNGSEIDLQSDTTSCHTVSLVDESTIKELIQEYNYEIQNNPFLNLRNNKLDTLREEEDMYSVFENYDMAETVSIQDTVLSSLIEQARNEGIFVAEDRFERQSPIHSYYEEALEVIRASSVNTKVAFREDTDNNDEIRVG